MSLWLCYLRKLIKEIPSQLNGTVLSFNVNSHELGNHLRIFSLIFVSRLTYLWFAIPHARKLYNLLSCNYDE